MADPVDPVPTPESAAPTGGAAERRYFWKHPLLKRAPIILIAALGIWLWRTSGSERQLIWQLPPQTRVSVRQVEIQLRNEDGKLVKREEFFYPSGAPSEIDEHARLRDGKYEALIILTEDGQPPKTVHLPVTVEGDTIIERLP